MTYDDSTGWHAAAENSVSKKRSSRLVAANVVTLAARIARTGLIPQRSPAQHSVQARPRKPSIPSLAMIGTMIKAARKAAKERLAAVRTEIERRTAEPLPVTLKST